MRILMLGNSFTSANDMPATLARLTGAEVVHHTRVGACLAEHLDPDSELGEKTQAALDEEFWDYVVLQEMGSLPLTARNSFLKSVGKLCSWIREERATPLLFATWAYQKDSPAMEEIGWIRHEEMAGRLRDAYLEAAGQNKALLADVGQKFSEMQEMQGLYADDGRDPGEAGSRLAAETIAAVIMQDREAKEAAGRIDVDPNLNRNDIRLRVLYMYQLLLRYTDADHQLTTNQIRAITDPGHHGEGARHNHAPHDRPRGH